MKTAANSALKAVIFDMDGVLLDSESLHYLAIDGVVSSRGGIYSVELLYKYCGVPEREIWPSLIKDTGLIGAEPTELMEEHWRRYRALLEEHGYPEFPGTRDFLTRLRERGLLLAVASASLKSVIEDYLRTLDLDGCFDVAVSAQECSHGKPEPDVFLLAAQKLGVEPAECMVIEDSPNGMIAARRAGMKWVGFEGAEVKPDMRYAVYKFSDYRTMTAEQLELWYRSFPQQERDE